MAMRNMWWHFRFLFGHSFSKLPDRMSDKLSWNFDMSATVPLHNTIAECLLWYNKNCSINGTQ